MTNVVRMVVVALLLMSNRFVFAAVAVDDLTVLVSPPAPSVVPVEPVVGAGGVTPAPAKVLFKKRDKAQTPQQLGYELLQRIGRVESEDDIKQLQTLLDAGADITVLGALGRNVLHYAATLPTDVAIKVLHFIIEQVLKLPDGRALLKQMINARDTDGQTPIMVSLTVQGVPKTMYAAGDMMRLFRVYRADFSIVDNEGKGALEYALQNGNKDAAGAIVKFLAEDKPIVPAGSPPRKRKPAEASAESAPTSRARVS